MAVQDSFDISATNSTRDRKQVALLPKIAFGCAGVALLVLPALFDGYELFLASAILAYAIAAMGLNVLMGFNGQISLGHGAFFAIGAYTAAISIEQFGIPLLAAPIVAGLTGILFGWLVGKPAMRLEGLYLALATFALALSIPSILRSDLFSDWTGGVQGIFLLLDPAPEWTGLNLDQTIYFAVLVYFFIFSFVTWRLVKGMNGAAWIATRDNQIAARAMGFDVARAKMRAFVYSATCCAVGGALYGIAVQFVAPDSFLFILSISLFTAVVVGGLCSPLVGPVLGSAFIVFVPNVTEEVWQGGSWAVYGAVIILIMTLQPGGLAGLFQAVANRWRS